MLLKRRNKDVQPEPINHTQDARKRSTNDTQTADTAPTTAEQALIAELSTLTAAGSGFVPPAAEPIKAPTVDSGIWNPPAKVKPSETPEAKRILKFVGVCEASVTHREICGGTGLQFDVVRELLPALVAAGALRIVEGSENLAQYRLAGFTPAPPAPKEPYIHPDVKWSNEQRARVLTEEAAKRPVPAPRRPEPSDAEVDAVIAAEKATTRPLTEAERRELAASRDRRPVNPQAFIVG